jgi:hypothetical protein
MPYSPSSSNRVAQQKYIRMLKCFYFDVFVKPNMAKFFLWIITPHTTLELPWSMPIHHMQTYKIPNVTHTLGQV